MANNYLQFSAILKLNSIQEREWATRELELLPGDSYGDDGDDYPEDKPKMRCEHTIDQEGIWFRAGEYGEPEDVANFVQRFLKEFRYKTGWHMTWACTCSKLRVDEFTGGGVFVTARKQKWFIPYDLINKEVERLGKAR